MKITSIHKIKIIDNDVLDIISNTILNVDCGEIPLCPYDSCRLLSINLFSFVDNPFTDDATFNWIKYKEYCNIAQRLMDDIIDLEEEKIDNILNKISLENKEINNVEYSLWVDIKEKLLTGRRTGLSGIGIADTLAALGIDYNSDEGIKAAETIYKQLAIHSYTSSIIMAKERGAFPICNVGKEAKHVFIERIYNELPITIQNLYLQYGRRNIANLTIPPSGSLSLLAQISSGIEPVYQIYYTRRRKVNPNDSNIKIDFTDQSGDCWQEYKIFHPKFISWYNIFESQYEKKQLSELSKTELDELIFLSPYYNNTAYDINPLSRIKLQSVVNQWIDHSISATANLKASTTKEEINDIYLNAWKNGLKGFTIYRDGSRSGVLISNEEITPIQDIFKPKESAKRPKELIVNIHRLTTLKEKWMVLIGIIDNNPYEVFALKEPDELTLPKHIKTGILTKVKRGIYKLSTKNGKEIIHIENIMDYMPDDNKADTRKYSLMLRHYIHPKFIVQTIDKFAKDITSFDKAISRVLKLYINDNEEVSGEPCPNCGNTLIYESGCASCKACGWEKC